MKSLKVLITAFLISAGLQACSPPSAPLYVEQVPEGAEVELGIQTSGSTTHIGKGPGYKSITYLGSFVRVEMASGLITTYPADKVISVRIYPAALKK